MYRAFVLCSLIYDGLRRTLFLRLLRRHTDIKLPRRDHASVLLHGWSRPVVYDVSCVRALLFDLRRPSANAEFCSHAFAWRSCKWLRPLRILESHGPPLEAQSLVRGLYTRAPGATLRQPFGGPRNVPGTVPKPTPILSSFAPCCPGVPVYSSFAPWCPGVQEATVARLGLFGSAMRACPGVLTGTLWLRDASGVRLDLSAFAARLY